MWFLMIPNHHASVPNVAVPENLHHDMMGM